jgi:hypothetical protein
MSTTINADFYVKNMKYELIPAKFLTGCDGNPVMNPNSPNNPIN